MHPPRGVTLPAGRIVAVPETDGAVALEKYGPAGVVARETGESDQDVLLRGRQVRLAFLVGQLNGYREQQAIRKAQNLELLMPRKHHRDWLKEVETLRAQVEQSDPVMTAALPTMVQEPVKDVLADELRSFGIAPEAAPMTPGLTGFEI